MSVFRDKPRPRPMVTLVRCPSCRHEYSLAKIAHLAAVECGTCHVHFDPRGVAIVDTTVGPLTFEGPQTGVTGEARGVGNEPLQGASKPKRYKRDGVKSPSTSTSVRTTEAQLDEWKAAAAAERMSFNSWIRQALDERVAYEATLRNFPATKSEREPWPV